MVSEAVVHALEAVEVDEERRHQRRGRHSVLQKLGLQPAAVRQAGRLVVHGRVLELALEPQRGDRLRGLTRERVGQRGGLGVELARVEEERDEDPVEHVIVLDGRDEHRIHPGVAHGVTEDRSTASAAAIPLIVSTCRRPAARETSGSVSGTDRSGLVPEAWVNAPESSSRKTPACSAW